jgi:hypothetical protein
LTKTMTTKSSNIYMILISLPQIEKRWFGHKTSECHKFFISQFHAKSANRKDCAKNTQNLGETPYVYQTKSDVNCDNIISTQTINQQIKTNSKKIFIQSSSTEDDSDEEPIVKLIEE